MVARGELPLETANVIDQALFDGLATLDRERAEGEGGMDEMNDFELGFEHGRRVLACRRLEEYDDELVYAVDAYPDAPHLLDRMC